MIMHAAWKLTLIELSLSIIKESIHFSVMMFGYFCANWSALLANSSSAKTNTQMVSVVAYCDSMSQ